MPAEGQGRWRPCRPPEQRAGPGWGGRTLCQNPCGGRRRGNQGGRGCHQTIAEGDGGGRNRRRSWALDQNHQRNQQPVVTHQSHKNHQRHQSQQPHQRHQSHWSNQRHQSHQSHQRDQSHWSHKSHQSHQSHQRHQSDQGQWSHQLHQRSHRRQGGNGEDWGQGRLDHEAPGPGWLAGVEPGHGERRQGEEGPAGKI